MLMLQQNVGCCQDAFCTSSTSKSTTTAALIKLSDGKDTAQTICLKKITKEFATITKNRKEVVEVQQYQRYVK